MKIDSISSSFFAKLLSYGIKEVQGFTYYEYNRVKFDVYFKEGQTMYFAYSEVYTYSMLCADIDYLMANKNRHEQQQEIQKKQIE